MDLWKKAKRSALKTKVRGEIAIIEREALGRKKAFGVELYDLLTNDKQKLLSVAAGTIFQGKQEELREPFDRAREDIAGINARKETKQKDLDVLEVRGARALPDETVNQKFRKAGRAVQDAGTNAKLRAEMVLLERDMKMRKERFGVEVFDLTVASEKSKSGIQDAISKTLTAVSKQEKDIQECIDRARREVDSIETKIKNKQLEMNLLDEEMAPLVNE